MGSTFIWSPPIRCYFKELLSHDITLKYFQPCISFSLLNFQAFTYEWFWWLTNIYALWKFWLWWCHNISKELRHASCSPWMSSCEKLKEYDSYAPDITFWAIRLLRKDLWRHIKRSSYNSASHLPWWRKSLCESEIGYLQSILL